MSYNPGIPQPTDPTLQSQQQIRSNYQVINSTFANNHVKLNNDLEGMHRVLTLRPQVLDPATAANQTAFYNKIVGAIPQAFYRPSSNQTPIQLTYESLDTDPTKLVQYSFVAGPFIVYGGKILGATIGQVVNLTPTSTLLYVGLVSANVENASPLNFTMSIPTNIAGSSFTITYSALQPGATLDVYYLAIGQ